MQTSSLSNVPLVLVFCIALVAILVSSEAGWRLARRTYGQEKGHSSTFESSMLGLLALMLAFTFSMALSHYEGRRQAVLNQANSIGTTILRARLLPEPERSEALKLLREYVRIRLDIAQRDTSLVELASAVDRSNAIQEALWQQVKTLTAKDKGLIPTGLFVTSLNQMIDDQGKRLSALRNGIPNTVIPILIFIAAVAAGFSGYASATNDRRSRVPVYMMGLLVSAVIFLIVDLDRPTSGFIINSQQPMIDLGASMTSPVD